MSDPPENAKAIFGKALECESVDERSAYVHQACVDDAELRSEVESLLLAVDQIGSFMAQPVLGPDFTVDEPTLESLGTQIGPYKLLEVIGQGGMGVVYMAQQSEPVERQVALKIIKPGMDSQQIIARFEGERQTLAMMDHPNIAKVYDAGTIEVSGPGTQVTGGSPETGESPSDTRSFSSLRPEAQGLRPSAIGRPYFAMELIKGLPITQYCDEHHLTPRERLELFLPVCQAIQHAHQKGIIHRDVKPSNILVAEYDQQPVPKVIDFGVARALHQSLAERTMFTGVGQVVGTLEYMSPEQADVNQLDIDTRSDIYSLGVLLYELLTGTTPFDRQRLRSAAWDEILRIIREEEPLRPSVKLSTIDMLASVAANRHVESVKLAGLVRGDLDWIVLKALEKDRNRRYEAATALAADIRHYLDNEPVQACPPSNMYRLRKFAKRNKVAFVATGMVAAALVIGTAVATWQAIRATRARNAEAEQRRVAEAAEKKAADEAAVSKAVNEFLQRDLLGLADAKAQAEVGMKPDPDLKLHTLLDRAAAKVNERFADQPFVRAQVQSTISGAYLGIGRYDEAIKLREQVRDYCERTHGPEHSLTLMAAHNLAWAYFHNGEYDKAIALEEQVLALQRRLLGPEHSDTRASFGNLAAFYHTIGQQTKAVPLLEQTLELERKISGPEHSDTLIAMNNLAETYRAVGKYDRAITVHEQALEAGRKAWGPEHPNTIVSMNNLALDYQSADQLDKAIPLFEQTRELMRKVLGPEHPYTIYATSNLAELYRAQGMLTEAEVLHSQALEIERRVLGADHPDTLISLRNLALVYSGQGAVEKALPLLDESVQRRKTRLEANPSSWPGLAECLFWQAQCLVKLARWTEAEAAARESLTLREQGAPDDWSRFSSMSLLGECLCGQQKYAEAEPLLRESYLELKKRRTSIAASLGGTLTDAVDRLIQLYESWGKPDEVAKWRQTREEVGERPKAGEKKE